MLLWGSTFRRQISFKSLEDSRGWGIDIDCQLHGSGRAFWEELAAGGRPSSRVDNTLYKSTRWYRYKGVWGERNFVCFLCFLLVSASAPVLPLRTSLADIRHRCLQPCNVNKKPSTLQESSTPSALHWDCGVSQI